MTDRTDDELIDTALASVTPKQWTRLWRALEAVPAESEHASLGGGERIEVIDDEERSVTQMPYVIYRETVDELTSALYKAGLVVPFNWPDWHGLEQARRDAVAGDLSADDAVRLITATVRSDRFIDGAISVALAEGSLQGAVGRLNRWVDEGRAN